MIIVSLNVADLAGLSHTLCKSINELTDHLAVSVVLKEHPYGYPFMLKKSSRSSAMIERLIDKADVLHINQYFERIITAYNLKGCTNKKIILHMHGRPFRQRRHKQLRQFAKTFPRFTLATSTPEMLHGVDGIWLPSIIPIDEYRERYKMKRNNPPVVYYSPSQRQRLPVFIKMMEELKEEGCVFKSRYPDRRIPYYKNLQNKAKADIYYDEIMNFYGINAIEAAAFEIPPIYGCLPRTRHYLENSGVECSFIQIDKPRGSLWVRDIVEKVKDEFRLLIEDGWYRSMMGRMAYKYAMEYHSPEPCVNKFLEVVES